MILPETVTGFPAADAVELPALLPGYGPCERCGLPVAPIGRSVSSYVPTPYYLCPPAQDGECRERAAQQGAERAQEAAREAVAQPPAGKAASARTRPSRARQATLLGAARKRAGTVPDGPEAA